MAITVQTPPFRIPLVDHDGHMPDIWQRFFLKISTNLTTNVAPSDAPFVISRANASLTGPVNLGLLTSGYVKIAVALSVATVSTVATVATTDLAGALQAAQEPAHSGDVTNSAGSLALAIGALKVTNAMLAGSIDLTTKVTGILPAADFPALTGDVTTSAGSLATAIGALKVTNAMLAGSIDLTTKVTGILPAADFPALTGDVTTSAGALATTLATTAVTAASYGSSTAIATFTVDTKGRLTAAANVTPQLTLTATYLSSLSGANLTALTAANISAGTAGISVTGNAGTATALQTARTINGVSFDGTANITLPTTIVMFTATATQTVANVGETTMLGTGAGTKTLTANQFIAGTTVRIMGSGIFSTQAVPGNVTIKMYLGTTVVATGTITNILALAANNAFDFMAEMTCRTTGAAGTVMVNGKASYDTGALVQGMLPLNNAGATTTIDTTVSQAIDVKLTWATLSAENTISTTTTSIETLN